MGLKPLLKVLSKEEAIRCLEFIQASTRCADENEFRRLMQEINAIVPHEHAISGFARLGPAGRLPSYSFINISYPNEWLQSQILKTGPQADPIVGAHVAKFQVQHYADIPLDRKYLALCEDYHLAEGYVHGARNLQGTAGSLFCFTGKRIQRSRRTEIVLDLLIPHLHQAMERTLKLAEKGLNPHGPPLADREKEVLKWLSQGKSNWDISKILGISQRTVKFHIENAMHKLGVSTRAHAVAIAIQYGLVDIE
jgi:DNA-binding CsgD family transcriptional regulator